MENSKKAGRFSSGLMIPNFDTLYSGFEAADGAENGGAGQAERFFQKCAEEFMG